MPEDSFDIQVSPKGLNDWLAIKSFGKQISSLLTSIRPVIDIQEYAYDPSFPQGSLTAVTTSSTFAQQGGNGVYRVRGNISLSISNGLNAGRFLLSIGYGLGGRSAQLMDIYLGASTVGNFSVNVDMFVDNTNVLSTPITQVTVQLVGPAAPTDVRADYVLRSQRVY